MAAAGEAGRGVLEVGPGSDSDRRWCGRPEEPEAALARHERQRRLGQAVAWVGVWRK
jgi:hypothetical protein